MKIDHTPKIEETVAQATLVKLIAPGLALAMLLSPFSYAVAQQSQTHDSQSASQSPSLMPQTQSPKPAQPPQASDDNNAPVPPLPPLDPAETASTPASSDLLPDSPGAMESAQLETSHVPVAQQSEAQPPTSQPAAQQPPPAMPKEPLGTAAAETVPTMGIAASRPAGAALAPAKQHRIRTILIRTGAVVGAAAAVGVTMALTEASPSKPPGAH
jgi:hypothetical protein